MSKYGPNYDAGVPERIAKKVGDKGYKKELYKNQQGGKLQIDHKATAHAFLKIVRLTPMHPTIKQIMTMRLVGVDPDYIPMSIMQIALTLGMRAEEITHLEKEGLAMASQFMQDMTFADIGNKFKENSRHKSGLQKDLLT